jgi:hypothetical protein
MPIQLDFILRRLVDMAEKQPELRKQQPWKAAHERDYGRLSAVVALGRVGQRVRPVEDRGELPGVDERGEGEQLLPLLFVREQSQPLSDEAVDHDRPKNGAHRPEHVAG